MKIEVSDEKILRMAAALREIEACKDMDVPCEGVLHLSPYPSARNLIYSFAARRPGLSEHRRFFENMAYEIFKPLLNQGLCEYRRRLREIADGKDEE